MRILITGGGDIGRITAERLVDAGHDVVLVEEDRQTCESIAEELDMLVVCGDAARPDTLDKAEMDKADLVIALSGSDQMNLITALVAKEYGVKRVIIKLDDPAFNSVCQKLGVEEIVNPKIATAKHIADMAKKPHAIEVSTLVGGSIRVFTTIIRREDHAGRKVEELELPEESLPVVVKRNEEFFIPTGDFKLLVGDHVTIICEEKTLERLGKLFG